ncbi:MAG TPA: hypothetical protein VMN39_05395 [Longimicrobiaceae bacterium]|nr:hypothetical protein [Longimicrobiaceae bacterium]
MLWIARTVILLALASCAPQAEPPDSLPAPSGSAEGALRGVVRIVGSAPVNVQVVLQPAEGGSVRLTGPLRDELATLAGAEVAVRGVLGPSPDPLADRQLEAIGYDIVAIDGLPVLVGEIVSVQGQQARMRTAEGEEVVLDVPAGVFRVGQKVWVQGPQRVSVQSFGVVRP